MKKRLSIALVLILALIIAGAAWHLMRPRKPVRITGNLTAQDVAEIKALVKQDLGRRVLPGLSWKSFKGLFSNARNYSQYEIMEVVATTNADFSFVAVRMPVPRNEGRDASVYTLSKASGSWRIVRIYPTVVNWREWMSPQLIAINGVAAFKAGRQNPYVYRAPQISSTNSSLRALTLKKSLTNLTDLALEPGRIRRPRVSPYLSFRSLASNENFTTLRLDWNEEERSRGRIYGMPVYPSIAPAPPVSATNFVPKR